MPKLTKRKTGDAFAFTTSTAMGKRIRHEAKFKKLSVSEFIRQVISKQVSPNVPVEGSSFASKHWGSQCGKTTLQLAVGFGEISKSDVIKEIKRLNT
jgi:hypothetical protein